MHETVSGKTHDRIRRKYCVFSGGRWLDWQVQAPRAPSGRFSGDPHANLVQFLSSVTSCASGWAAEPIRPLSLWLIHIKNGSPPPAD